MSEQAQSQFTPGDIDPYQKDRLAAFETHALLENGQVNERLLEDLDLVDMPIVRARAETNPDNEDLIAAVDYFTETKVKNSLKSVAPNEKEAEYDQLWSTLNSAYYKEQARLRQETASRQSPAIFQQEAPRVITGADSPVRLEIQNHKYTRRLLALDSDTPELGLEGLSEVESGSDNTSNIPSRILDETLMGISRPLKNTFKDVSRRRAQRKAPDTLTEDEYQKRIGGKKL